MKPAEFFAYWTAASSALVLVAMPGPSRAADTSVTHVVANSWQSSDFNDPANPGCSIGGAGSMPGGRIIMGASQRRPAPMSLVVRKTGWAIPAGTQVQIRASFPDGSTMDFTGRGKGQVVDIEIDKSQLRAWVHNLTANTNMQLTFAGSEPPWRFDLTGTSKVVNAMDRCLAAHRIEGVDPPFLSAVDSGMGRVASATQPFGGTFDGPLNPRAVPSAPGPVPEPTRSREPSKAAAGQPAQGVDTSPLPRAVAVQPSSTATAPSAGAASCKDDWRGCSDNADLVNNFKDYYKLAYRCKEEASQRAKYGTPVWPGFWSGGSFTRFRKGTDYVSTGIVLAVEPDAQFQNGFGAMVNSTVMCKYDLRTETVVSVEIIPK